MKKFRRVTYLLFLISVAFIVLQYNYFLEPDSKPKAVIEQKVSVKTSSLKRPETTTDDEVVNSSEEGSEYYKSIVNLYSLVKKYGESCEKKLEELSEAGVINDRYALDLREGESVNDVLKDLPFESYIGSMNKFIEEASITVNNLSEKELKNLFDLIGKKDFLYGNTECSVEKMQIIWMNISSLPKEQKTQAFRSSIGSICQLVKNEKSFVWLRGYLETILSFTDSKLIDLEYKAYLTELYTEFLNYTDDFEQEDFDHYELLNQASSNNDMKASFIKKLFNLHRNRSEIVSHLRDQLSEVICEINSQVNSN